MSKKGADLIVVMRRQWGDLHTCFQDRKNELAARVIRPRKLDDLKREKNRIAVYRYARTGRVS